MPFMEWTDVQRRACGSPEIPVEDLKVSFLRSPALSQASTRAH